MKSHGILNGQLAGAIARLGHTDEFVIADCGLPVPVGIPIVDLAVVVGTPGIGPVLDAVLAETVVEGAILASEGTGSEFDRDVARRLSFEVDRIPHDDLKRRVANARFVVRTGEATPFANVVLRAGVAFD